MKFTKYLLLCFLITFFTACEEDDEDSVSSSGTPITCEMILEYLGVDSFEDVDLGDFSASCDSAIITIASEASDEKVFDCNGTTVTASDPNGSITVDMSEVTVSGENLSGDVSLESSIGATLTPASGSGVVVDCNFAFEGDIDDEDDIELSSFSSCVVGGTTISFLEVPDNADECSTEVGGGRTTDPGFRMFYAFFDDLASKVIPEIPES